MFYPLTIRVRNFAPIQSITAPSAQATPIETSSPIPSDKAPTIPPSYSKKKGPVLNKTTLSTSHLSPKWATFPRGQERQGAERVGKRMIEIGTRFKFCNRQFGVSLPHNGSLPIRTFFLFTFFFLVFFVYQCKSLYFSHINEDLYFAVKCIYSFNNSSLDKQYFAINQIMH